MTVRELPKDVLKMASGLISPSGLAGHRRQLCNGPAVWHRSAPAAVPKLQVKLKADNFPTFVTDTDTVTAEQSSVAAVQDDSIHQHCP